MALVRFAAVSRASPSGPWVAEGREAGLATLCAAAAQLHTTDGARATAASCGDARTAMGRSEAPLYWF